MTRMLTAPDRARRRIVWLVLIVFAVIGGAITYVKFFREEPAPFFASDEEHFLFGSTGTEEQQGVPYWIWLVLPRVFPEHLPAPGGYASIGMLSKDGHEMPIGLSKVTIGFPRVAINCAVCHAASYRARADDPPTIVAAGPAHQTAPQMYLRFLFACASDPRFTPDTLLNEISKNVKLSMLDRMLYRFAIIPQTRKALLRLRDSDSWMLQRPDWGRGRIDPFNPVKYTTLKQPIDSTIGNSDMVPLWNLGAHRGYAFHWDGLNTNLQEVVLSSAIGDGTSLKWVDRDYKKWNNTKPEEMSSLRRVQNYISSVQAPKYPFAIDQARATAGATVYNAHCASCHAIGGTRTGSVIPLAEIGTDRHRLDMWTPASAAAYNAYGEGHPWKFSAFRSTNGYVTAPLEGLWLRAPYLHNGSVPTLVALLEPTERRPTRFWRGYTVYDPESVGFVSTGPAAAREGTVFDVTLPGNGNAGHTYGTELPPDEKRALLEYLKTL
jgi:processive rubber oxygenase RoxA-like protein